MLYYVFCIFKDSLGFKYIWRIFKAFVFNDQMLLAI